MKKLVSSLCASALAATMMITSLVTANAQPIRIENPAITTGSSSLDPILVQNRHYRDGNRRYPRGFYHDRRGGDRYFYNGHRGYRDYRPGYRRHGDFWFPAGAFIAGALIGGAMNAPRDRIVRRLPDNSHTAWCANRYRSYRAYDNTFQPNNGPRKQCVSPY